MLRATTQFDSAYPGGVSLYVGSGSQAGALGAN
jgi:hypothetical protein